MASVRSLWTVSIAKLLKRHWFIDERSQVFMRRAVEKDRFPTASVAGLTRISLKRTSTSETRHLLAGQILKFSNLLGTVYKKGNLLFTPDGNSVLSPVGNRVTLFNLKNNKSETLPLESSLNITCIALSPDGHTLILVNEGGEALLCNLSSKVVLHRYHFHKPIQFVKFSPDGKKFAVAKESMVEVYFAPGQSREFNPFVLYRTFYGAYDETTCIDWSTDSQAFCVGSKDMSTRVYGSQRFNNLIVYSLGGHSDAIVGAFFENQSLDVYSVSERGYVCVWGCDSGLEDLVPYSAPEPKAKVKPGKRSQDDNGSEDESQEDETEEDEEDKSEQKSGTKQIQDQIITDKKPGIVYKKLNRYSLREARGEGAGYANLTSTDYHKHTHILLTGFQDGAFFLHEMPDFNLIHSLSISDQVISSGVFNSTGDWLALACSGLGQLLVWEWQSESYILKQQGHFNNMACLCYSPDGQYISTGGDDGKLKVWNSSSGFCFVTFTEHLAAVTGVRFNQNGQVVVSASLDGTVRAFDLNRYRNFRTFTSPRPAQFSCLSLDHSGELVCAGGLDTFEIFVWSMKTGRLLEVLSGHEGPISSLCFSSAQALLASGSWDKTVKFWDIFENKGAKETLTLLSDVLDVSFRPDGNEVAVATLDAQISFWSPHTAVQTGSIEGRHDLGYSRKDTDKITAKKSSFGKSFETICYSADGTCLLAAGKSKNVCIYSVSDQLLMKKFEISCNFSYDGMQQFLNKKSMTEWGSLSLINHGEEDEGGRVSLPGVRHGDKSSRHWRPEVRVTAIQFSPTGNCWCATTTEGLLVYSLDHNLLFDPFQLEIDITPSSVRRTLSKGDYSTALMLSFKLNEQKLIEEVAENIPPNDIELVVRSLPDYYVDKMLEFSANQIERSAHLEFYLTWIHCLLFNHGPRLKQRSQSIMATVCSLQKNVNRKYEDLSKICDHNRYTMQYILSLGELRKGRELVRAADSGSELEEEESVENTDSEMGEELMVT